MTTCPAKFAEGWPGERPCTYPASRPSGLCGLHDNARKRREAAASAAARRIAYRAEAYLTARHLCDALWAAGVPCEPRLSGVHLSISAAEDLLRRLVPSTEGAAS